MPHVFPTDQTLIAMCRALSLDTGESEALALMEGDPAAIFLTDDSAARMVPERMGYRVHGTIGILLRSIRRNQLNPKEVLGLLDSLPPKCSLFIKPSLLDEIKLRVKDIAVQIRRRLLVLWLISLDFSPRVGLPGNQVHRRAAEVAEGLFVVIQSQEAIGSQTPCLRQLRAIHIQGPWDWGTSVSAYTEGLFIWRSLTAK